MLHTIELGLGQDASTDWVTILPIADIKGRDGRMVRHLAGQKEKQSEKERCHIPSGMNYILHFLCVLVCVLVKSCRTFSDKGWNISGYALRLWIWFYLFGYVESAAVGLRVKPAATKCFSQNWIVRLLQTLRAKHKQRQQHQYQSKHLHNLFFLFFFCFQGKGRNRDYHFFR